MEYPLTIFFDGACGVCSREIKHYMSIADQRIRFVDIAGENFNPGVYGKDHADFQREMHACDNRGVFYTGVEAFRRLWESLPSPIYPTMSKFIGLPVINFCARSAYSLFARYRHLFSRTDRKTCKLQ